MLCKKIIILILFIGIGMEGKAQIQNISGTVLDANLQPLSYATVRVKNVAIGTTTDAKGFYSLALSADRYELVVSLIGYKTQEAIVILQNKDVTQNFILLHKSIKEVVIKNTKKDISEDIIKKVIVQKDKINKASENFTCKMYIKAKQTTVHKKSGLTLFLENISNQDSNSDIEIKDSAKIISDSAKISLAQKDTLAAVYKRIENMAMAEVVAQIDVAYPNKLKETRIGIKKNGTTQSLFYLSRTEGSFNFYNNLVQVPALSEQAFLSPISYSGLIAYNFKMLSITEMNGRKQYRIKITPTKTGNALVSGEVIVEDSSFVIKSMFFEFPKHQTPEYSYFSLSQKNEEVEKNIWLPTRQTFNYQDNGKSHKQNGITEVIYSNYITDTIFPKKHFGEEISSATRLAYKQDSAFWSEARPIPLTVNEIEYIHIKDSVYQATHSEKYLDSIDKKTNKVRLVNLLWFGQENYKRSKERRIYFPPLPSYYQPFFIGGTRVSFSMSYYKRYPNYKSFNLSPKVSYGVLNKDVNFNLNANFLYNPFSRGQIYLQAYKDFAFIFNNDAIINLISRSSIYLNKGGAIGHNIELLNGLYLFNEVEFGERSSLVNYKRSNTSLDSLFNNTNVPRYFETFKEFYNVIRLRYTHKQMYIREPNQKVVLGSKYPSVFASIRFGIPNVFGSNSDFAFLQIGADQIIKAGTIGTGEYSIKFGKYLSKKQLQLNDYKWIRRGELLLFLNPQNNFQGLDSTFAIFNSFTEGHYVHNFNGSIINKIPFAKRLKLSETAGGGILLVPERNLKYIEGFVGIEKSLVLFNQPIRFGVYAVSSIANKFNNPLQWKIGIRIFDKQNNIWR
jgi:hypothetical protein